MEKLNNRDKKIIKENREIINVKKVQADKEFAPDVYSPIILSYLFGDIDEKQRNNTNNSNTLSYTQQSSQSRASLSPN